MCLTSCLSSALPATELEQKVTSLEETLAAKQKQVQVMADAALQQAEAAQRLNDEVERLRSACQANEAELVLVKVCTTIVYIVCTYK